MVNIKVGDTYGRLTVLAKKPCDHWRRSVWDCQCRCGIRIDVLGARIRNSKNPSCGCWQREQVSKANTKYVTLDDYLTNTKPHGHCLEWQGYTTTSGYGFVGTYKSKHIEKRSGLVHRRVYELAHGTTPKVVLHTCDNRLCVNPEHLVGGTQKDNIKDMVNKGRMGSQRTAFTMDVDGIPMRISELSKRFGISVHTMQWRKRHNKNLITGEPLEGL